MSYDLPEGYITYHQRKEEVALERHLDEAIELATTIAAEALSLIHI